MDNDKQQQRRVKVTGEDRSRTGGTRHAAVKPHKVSSGSVVKQTITSYVSGLKAGTLTQSTWGDTLAKKAATVRTNFGLTATDEPYLLLDLSSNGSAKAGMVLAESGVHLADGKGGSLSIGWKDLASTKIAYQRNMLVIGQSGITSKDGAALATLLQQLQAKAS